MYLLSIFYLKMLSVFQCECMNQLKMCLLVLKIKYFYLIIFMYRLNILKILKCYRSRLFGLNFKYE